jgi:subtilisin family serine protease
MKTVLVGRRGGLVLVALFALALCLGPAEAGKPEENRNSKDEGGINPTSIAVVDDDLMLSVVYADAELSPESQIDAPVAHFVATGKGVTIAVLDGGFNLNHPSIAHRLTGRGFDAVDGDEDAHDPGNGIDDDRDGRIDNALGHGTFVSGMILDAAPDAMILPIRVRNDEGFGTNEVLTQGVKLAVAEGVQVMNLSLENADASDKGLKRALSAAVRSGIVLVLSAGNDGHNWLSDIAYGTGRIAVGAVDAHDTIAPFSNYVLYETGGLMTFAPGVDLYGPMGAPEDDSMGFWSGTSFSAGFVSGAVALHIQLNPDDDPQEVIAALKTAVDPVYLTADDDVPVQGVGRVNLSKVIADGT